MSEEPLRSDRDPTPTRQRQWPQAGAFTCPLLAAMVVAAYYLLLYNRGIRVTVQNTNSHPLRSVVLFVTRNSYNLGDILPGATADATALEIVLRPWALGDLGYHLARRYAERYDPRHGTGLIPSSAPMVENIAEFWGKYFLGRGWKKMLSG